MVFLKKYFFIFISLMFVSMVFVYNFDLPISEFIFQSKIIEFDTNKLMYNYPIIVSEDFLAMIVLVLLSGFIVLLKFKRNINIYVILMYLIIGLFVTIEIKSGLKFFFGRCVPNLWLSHKCNLGAGLYPFNWSSGIDHEGSFPSGHCVIITYCLVWIDYFLPKHKILLMIFLIITVLLLVLLKFHFLGDCFAGTAIGYICAAIVIGLYKVHLFGKKSCDV